MNESPRINDSLRQARLGRGWTQRRLAAEVGVDDQTVRSWERGRRTPSLEFRSRLCEVLQKTPEQLGLSSKQELQSLSTEREVIDQAVVPSSALTPPYPVRFERDYIVLNRGDQNRQRMIRRVRSRWISGVLDHVSRIPLVLQEQPDAVESPWRKNARDILATLACRWNTHHSCV
jgi:transcriptional regulator with XRE-family HTH domain